MSNNSNFLQDLLGEKEKQFSELKILSNFSPNLILTGLLGAKSLALCN